MDVLNTIFQAIADAVNNARGPITIVAIIAVGVTWLKGHHFIAAIELAVAVGVIFTAATLAPTIFH